MVVKPSHATSVVVAGLVVVLLVLSVVWVLVTADNRPPPRTALEKLQKIHAKLKFSHGSLDLEYPEQLMAASHIGPKNVVLEIGGNIGRNSCVIASLLDDSSNLVVFESDPDTAKKLLENRDANGFSFAVETCAISKKKLVQNGWNTRPVPEDDGAQIENGWTPVDTMSWSQVRAKYRDKRFDTLVVDCEGGMFYILADEPDFLETFKTIIIENDFQDIEHKRFVDSEFVRFGFRNVYREAGGFGPCYDNFFEVWKR